MSSSNRHGRQRFHKPRVEALETRAVLSVCGVECALSDGVLSVAGTDGDDAIALRYDPYVGLVSVFGGGNELIGQYPLSQIARLNVTGGHGNDHFEVDTHLPLEVNLAGGEGEDSFAAFVPSGHSHSGGVIQMEPDIERILPFTSANSSSPSLSSGPVFGPALPNLGSSTALSNSAASPGANGSSSDLPISSSLLLSLTGGTHSGHSQSSAAAPSLLSDPAGAHSAHGGYSVAGSLAAVAGSAAYGAAYVSLTADDGAWQTADAAGAEGHQTHRGQSPSGEVVAKFAPKRCKVRLTSKEASRTVTGEKKCDCAAKQAAAEAAAARAAAAEQNTTATAAKTTTTAACPRCQMALEQAAGDEILAACALPLNDGEPVDGQTADSEHELVWSEPTGGSWLPSSQLTGLGLVGAGLLLAPALRRKSRRGQSDADRFAAAADFCFGRLAVERLAR